MRNYKSLIKGVDIMKLSIGENIKLFRKAKDITQEQLAEMLNVSSRHRFQCIQF